jgi:hypothetical protein
MNNILEVDHIPELNLKFFSKIGNPFESDCNFPGCESKPLMGKKILVIRMFDMAVLYARNNSVTYLTDDPEKLKKFHEKLNTGKFGSDDSGYLVEDWNNFEKSEEIGIKNMKFDVVIMNPPYDGNLHLKILEKVIPIADKVVNISPATWFAKHSRWKKAFIKYNASVVGKPNNISYIEHRQANDIFGLGNQIARLAISLYDSKNTVKIDLLKEEFSSNIEFSLFNKVLSPRTEKMIWRNGNNIVEPKNTTLQYTQPVNIWHGGKNCYDAALGMSKNHQKGKIQWQAQFMTQQELINFRNSMRTTFMNWYYYNIVVPADNKLHMSMFVMQDYTQPWDDKRFCSYFGITGYIDNEHAVPNSEWEIILNTMKE